MTRAVFDDPVERIRKCLAELQGPPPWIFPQPLTDESAARWLLAYVKRSPGCTMREARQTVGLTKTRMINTCRRLVTDAQLYIAQAPGRLLLFPYLEGIAESWQQIVPLRDPAASRLYLRIWVDGPCREADLVRAAAPWGLSRDGVKWWLRRLRRAGLLRTSRPHRARRTYTTLPLSAASMALLTRGSVRPEPPEPVEPDFDNGVFP